MATARFREAGFCHRGDVGATARQMIDRFEIRTASVDAPVATLSGGNAQKVIIARELALCEAKLVIAMNPVRGLDVAATNFVYEQLLAIRPQVERCC